MDKQISHLFIKCNLIATVMIVGTHCRTSVIEDAYSLNSVIQELLCNGIFRIAIPLFAFMAGYLFFNQFCGYRPHVLKKVKSLFVPYSIAASLSVLFLHVGRILSRGTHVDLSIAMILENAFLIPPNVPLWFIRDLLVINLICPILLLVNRDRVIGPLIVIIGITWFLEVPVFPKTSNGWPLINMETLFFFLLAAPFSKKKSFLGKRQPSMKWISCLGLFIAVMLAARIYLEPKLDIWEGEYNLIGLILQKSVILSSFYLALLLIPMIPFGEYSSILYKHSFFIYAYQWFLLSSFKFITKRWSLPFMDLSFYFLVPLTIITLTAMAMILEVKIPRFYEVLSGFRIMRKKELMCQLD